MRFLLLAQHLLVLHFDALMLLTQTAQPLLVLAFDVLQLLPQLLDLLVLLATLQLHRVRHLGGLDQVGDTVRVALAQAVLQVTHDSLQLPEQE